MWNLAAEIGNTEFLAWTHYSFSHNRGKLCRWIHAIQDLRRRDDFGQWLILRGSWRRRVSWLVGLSRCWGWWAILVSMTYSQRPGPIQVNKRRIYLENDSYVVHSTHTMSDLCSYIMRKRLNLYNANTVIHIQSSTARTLLVNASFCRTIPAEQDQHGAKRYHAI